MKTLLLAGATLALLIAVTSLPQRHRSRSFPAGTLGRHLQSVDTSSANAATTAAHYEYQYGYDKHAAWRGHWVLVR